MKRFAAVGVGLIVALGVASMPNAAAGSATSASTRPESKIEASSADAPPPQTEEEAAAQLEELSKDPFTWESQPIGTALQAVNSAFPDVASYISVDPVRHVFQVSYSDQADRSRIDEYLAAIAAVNSKYPVEVTARSYTLADQNAVAAKIAAEPDKYADILGGLPGTIVPEKDGSIMVRLRDSSAEERWTEVDGIGIRTVPDTDGQALGRLNDGNPWTGGSKIQSPTQYCTQGFRWERWNTLQIGIGTAKHCGSGTWSTMLGAVIGTPLFVSSNSLDQQFVRVTNGTASSTVWVSPSAEYPVVGAAVLLPGAVIASSLGNTGMTVTSVAGQGVYGWDDDFSYIFGPMDYSWSTNCVGGDSGGPWLTTTGGPEAIAHGQLWGSDDFYPGNNLQYCGYYNINQVSYALQSTLK